jgi:hypothetical protein
MAHDLIPPPSPAGRPGREGAPLLGAGEPEPARADPAEPAEPAAARAPRLAPDSPHRIRFGFLLGGLVGVALAAAIVLATLATRSGGDEPATGWSAWHPRSEDRLSAAQEIANRVGRGYRLADGDQLVAVRSSDLEIEAGTTRLPFFVAVRTAANGGDIELIDGTGVMYTLNGLGPRGSIPSGKPSEERHLLLRREALELALYTFRYIDDVDLVVALLPPAPPKKGETAASANPTHALLFRPGDLQRQLESPLQATLAPRPPRPETVAEPEATRVESLTRRFLFLAQFQQAQDTHAFLFLDRPPDG